MDSFELLVVLGGTVTDGELVGLAGIVPGVLVLPGQRDSQGRRRRERCGSKEMQGSLHGKRAANAPWATAEAVTCLSGAGLTITDLAKGTASSTALAKADANPVCLQIVGYQDEINNMLVAASGDCAISPTLTLFETTFHDNGYVSGWVAALKGVQGIDFAKTDATLYSQIEAENLPDCSRGDFDLVDATWTSVPGLACLNGTNFTLAALAQGRVPSAVLEAAATNTDCAAALTYQGQVVDYIVTNMGDYNVSPSLSLYEASLLNFTGWAEFVKSLSALKIDTTSKAQAAPITFRPTRGPAVELTRPPHGSSGNHPV
ncbi:Aste57867_14146 [Aphanomyces stellatus]|uniref:Aste57867_14146 protein n=1 Tax=Aphanomyces stellatus TaxID=120398 RepID=A0A485KZX0_9STRA|nr:hypothetical protein As57867_014095 [Aphanomyces stellatus]VFT90972.1 Aste57867_14146 [Aphanomyces stellatus]